MIPKEIHIIGCGGVACNLIIPLLQTAQFAFESPDIHLWDGDKFEKQNIGRQFAANNFLDRNKAEAFAEQFGYLYDGKITAHPDYFHQFSHEFKKGSLVICMCDNHAARRSCRAAVDDFSLFLISGANETEEGEAWTYLPDWKGTSLDPWVRYPDLSKDIGIDPIRATGCQSDAAFADNPQIPAGNMMTASGILWLINGMFREDTDPDYEYGLCEVRFMKNNWRATTVSQMLKNGGAL